MVFPSGGHDSPMPSGWPWWAVPTRQNTPSACPLRHSHYNCPYPRYDGNSRLPTGSMTPPTAPRKRMTMLVSVPRHRHRLDDLLPRLSNRRPERGRGRCSSEVMARSATRAARRHPPGWCLHPPVFANQPPDESFTSFCSLRIRRIRGNRRARTARSPRPSGPAA